MKRKIISALLAAAMLLPLTAFADEPTISDWAKEEIETADSIGLIPPGLGIADYTQEIKRDKFCSLALALLKAEAASTDISVENPFTDTDDEDVIILSGIGIIYGKGEGIFAPDDDITREEAAAILYRMAEYMAFPEPVSGEFTYSDGDDISDWALSSVYAMRYMGVMYGVSDAEFSPKGTYTVEQSVATMLRLYSYAESSAPTPEPAAEPTPTTEPAPEAKRGSLNEDRSSHMSVTVGDNVYVIGGTNEGDKLVNNIEVCKGGTNLWSYESTSDYILKNAAAAVNGSTIYIIGGEKDNKAVDTITAYDTETKEWSEIGNTGAPVKSAKAACLDNKLYITDSDYTKATDSIIIYDLESDETDNLDYPQTLIHPIPVAHNDKLYVFAGTDTDKSAYVYSDGEWVEKTASPDDYRLFEGQSDGDKIYFYAHIGSEPESILEYDTEEDTWRVIMDSYIKDRGAYGFALCGGYVYITGGLDTRKLVVKDYAEPYYYKWTYADYDADADVSFKKTIGFDYESYGNTFDTLPEIVTVDVRILDNEQKIYELTARYSCDEAAVPYFFWESYSGCFDGANTDYSRVVYHADSGSDSARINVGMGDGSGWTDKKTFTIPIN